MPVKPGKGAGSSFEGKKSHVQVRAQYRVLDEAARNRRNRHVLEKLEKDNFHDDPHANLVMHKKAPRFEDNAIKSSTSGHSNSRRQSHKIRQVGFHALQEEDAKNGPPNYLSAAAPPPGLIKIDDRIIVKVTKRHFCCVCGLKAPYTCITCGMRFCCVSCLTTHRDTRCLKWTM